MLTVSSFNTICILTVYFLILQWLYRSKFKKLGGRERERERERESNHGEKNYIFKWKIFSTQKKKNIRNLLKTKSFPSWSFPPGEFLPISRVRLGLGNLSGPIWSGGIHWGENWQGGHFPSTLLVKWKKCLRADLSKLKYCIS